MPFYLPSVPYYLDRGGVAIAGGHIAELEVSQLADGDEKLKMQGRKGDVGIAWSS